MNETIVNTHVVDDDAPASSHATPLDLVQLLHTYMPREALRRVVVEAVNAALADYLRAEGEICEIGETGESGELALADHFDRLRQARAVALAPELCTLMARVGFDKSLFTYGQIDGRASGFSEGGWLVKFVGLADAGCRNAPAAARRQRFFARQA